MTQEARSAADSRKNLPPSLPSPDSHSYLGLMRLRFQHYQAAVQLLQQGKFERALAAFEKILPTAPLPKFASDARCTSPPASAS